MIKTNKLSSYIHITKSHLILGFHNLVEEADEIIGIEGRLQSTHLIQQTAQSLQGNNHTKVYIGLCCITLAYITESCTYLSYEEKVKYRFHFVQSLNIEMVQVTVSSFLWNTSTFFFLLSVNDP